MTNSLLRVISKTSDFWQMFFSPQERFAVNLRSKFFCAIAYII
ncbi:hypothetical protein [Nostoc sp. FACHB-280]|nr:hypothetical protein [Nostoc sp. FACHB-280]